MFWLACFKIFFLTTVLGESTLRFGSRRQWHAFIIMASLHSVFSFTFFTIGWITFCRYTKSSCSSLEPSYEELTFVDLDLGPDYLREEFSSNDGQDEDTVEFIQPPKRLTTRNPPFQVSCLHFRYLKILFCLLRIFLISGDWWVSTGCNLGEVAS